jgi:hypothetical protein
MRALSLSWCVLAIACGSPAPSVPHVDAGRDAGHDDSGLAMGDGGSTDAPSIDAGSGDGGASDAPMTDASAVDAPSNDAHAASDAGSTTPPVVDGVIGATEYAAGTTATSTTVTAWTGNDLMALHAIAVGGTLYVAIEGQVDSFNGMVIYLDGDPGGTNGIANLSTLSDGVGALDNVISAGFTTPANDRWDLAWGTTQMSRTIVGADDKTGFRDITNSPANFGWIVTNTAQTVCSASVCEASIPTAMLPGTSPRMIAMFARISDSAGLNSANQTLPMDDPTMPRVVSVVTTITEM